MSWRRRDESLHKWMGSRFQWVLEASSWCPRLAVWATRYFNPCHHREKHPRALYAQNGCAECRRAKISHLLAKGRRNGKGWAVRGKASKPFLREVCFPSEPTVLCGSLWGLTFSYEGFWKEREKLWQRIKWEGRESCTSPHHFLKTLALTGRESLFN